MTLQEELHNLVYQKVIISKDGGLYYEGTLSSVHADFIVVKTNNNKSVRIVTEHITSVEQL